MRARFLHAQKSAGSRKDTSLSPPYAFGSPHSQHFGQFRQSRETAKDFRIGRKDKYVPHCVTNTDRTLIDPTPLQTTILLKVYHSPLYVP